MSFSARVVLDSIAPCGKRLTTMVATYPRYIHAQMLTHRQLSRNSASSRAIPVKKMIDMVISEPVIPCHWGKNQSGMQAFEELSADDQFKALAIWLAARDDAVKHATDLMNLGVHKQIANRLLEPFMWITVIITATEWANLYGLRRHDDAQPDIHKITNMMYDAQQTSTPVAREWHIPWIQPDEECLPLEDRLKIGTARNARVSYLTHEGKRDYVKDIDLYNKLITGSGTGHWSPFEHCARALDLPIPSGNFVGWEQYRKTFSAECLK